MISTRPEGEVVLEQVVPTMSIGGPEEMGNDPDAHSENVEVTGSRESIR
jgi:hypothetical protein